MNFSRLRALVIFATIVALFSLIAVGYSVAELEAIAGNEWIPEISAAAGMALGSSYAETMTEAALEELAVNGPTIGQRTAAGAALAILYRNKTGEELLEILKGTADPMIRAAAIEPALEHLLSITSEEEGFSLADYLKDLATTGETSELRLAAAKAYYIVTANDATAESAAADAAGEGELALAAGEILGGFYLFFPPVKTQAELEEIAVNGETEGLRVAGRDALASVLINSDLTVQELQTTLTSIVGTQSAEFRDAYKIALATRFSA